MITLLNSNQILAIQVSNLSSIGGNLGWYCNWLMPAGAPGTQFGNNVGIVNIPYCNQPIFSPTTMVTGPINPNNQYEITEITVCNTNFVQVPFIPPAVCSNVGVITDPLNIIIYFSDPTILLNYVQLFHCVLQPGDTLSYNATPGQDGSWSIFDARGKKVN